MRLDAGHELGHLAMHADVTPGGHEVEGQAFRFGGAFLVPRESFVLEWPRWLNWDQIFEMKRRWGMSAAALVRRAYDLELLSEPSYRRANMYLRQLRVEPAEWAPEYPTLLTRSIELLRDDVSLEQLAAELGLSASDLEGLVRGDAPIEALGRAPALAREQLSLLPDDSEKN
jgi:Zn-dependent peptidase ImmA (M78 family)